MANGILDYAQLGAPVFNFAKGLAIGPSEAYVSDTMRNQLIQKAKETELDKGTLGYEAFGLPVATEGGRFTGGLFDLALKDPVSFANVGSVGRVSFEKDPTAPGGYRFGNTEFDFTPDKDTGSTGNAILDFINQGGIKSAAGNLKDRIVNFPGNFFFAPALAPEVTDKERQSIELEDDLMNYNEFYDMPEEKKRESLLSRILELGKGLGGGIVDAAKGAGTALSNLGIVGLLRNFDNFKNLSPIDQQFILSQAGGNRPMQDRFGYNIRSARGNYAQLVGNRADIAKDRLARGLPLRAIDQYYLNKEKERAAAAKADFDRLNAIRQQRDADSMSGGAGETTSGTFGSSVNDPSTFSDYS